MGGGLVGIAKALEPADEWIPIREVNYGERRVWYVDISNLPSCHAEDFISKLKEKLKKNG